MVNMELIKCWVSYSGIHLIFGAKDKYLNAFANINSLNSRVFTLLHCLQSRSLCYGLQTNEFYWKLCVQVNVNAIKIKYKMFLIANHIYEFAFK